MGNICAIDFEGSYWVVWKLEKKKFKKLDRHVFFEVIKILITRGAQRKEGIVSVIWDLRLIPNK